MPNERRGGGPASSRAADIEPPSASFTRSVTLPGYVPPPRPQGPKSVRARQRCSEAVIAGPGTCQWRPLEQLVGPPSRPPPPPSVRPTALTIPPPPSSTALAIPPPPSSLQGLADSTGPNAAAPSRPPPSHRARSFILAICALAVGVGIGAAVMQRGELKKSAAVAKAPPSFERHSVAEPPATSFETAAISEPSPIEIALDDEAEGRKDPLARRRAAQRALSKTVERPSDILPEFPFPDEPKPAAPTAPAIKKSKRELAEEAKEAKDLAAAQLESLL